MFRTMFIRAISKQAKIETNRMFATIANSTIAAPVRWSAAPKKRLRVTRRVLLDFITVPLVQVLIFFAKRDRCPDSQIAKQLSWDNGVARVRK